MTMPWGPWLRSSPLPTPTPTKVVGRQDLAVPLGCLLLRKVVFQNGTHSAIFRREKSLETTQQR